MQSWVCVFRLLTWVVCGDSCCSFGPTSITHGSRWTLCLDCVFKRINYYCLSMRECIHTRTHTYMHLEHTHIRTHMHVSKHTCTCTCMHPCTHARTHTHTHTHTHTRTHTHTHTHTHFSFFVLPRPKMRLMMYIIGRGKTCKAVRRLRDHKRSHNHETTLFAKVFNHLHG